MHVAPLDHWERLDFWTAEEFAHLAMGFCVGIEERVSELRPTDPDDRMYVQLLTERCVRALAAGSVEASGGQSLPETAAKPLDWIRWALALAVDLEIPDWMKEIARSPKKLEVRDELRRAYREVSAEYPGKSDSYYAQLIKKRGYCAQLSESTVRKYLPGVK